MCRYSHQISFTSSSWCALLSDAADPFAAIRAPIESLGGQLIHAFFADDSYDVLALSEFPESVAADAISIAFYAGGAVAMIHSTPLLTAWQAQESKHRRSACMRQVPANRAARSASAS